MSATVLAAHGLRKSYAGLEVIGGSKSIEVTGR